MSFDALFRFIEEIAVAIRGSDFFGSVSRTFRAIVSGVQKGDPASDMALAAVLGVLFAGAALLLIARRQLRVIHEAELLLESALEMEKVVHDMQSASPSRAVPAPHAHGRVLPFGPGYTREWVDANEDDSHDELPPKASGE